MQPADGPGLKLADGGSRKFRCGFCRKDPPIPYMEMVPHPMNPQIGQLKQKRMMPITLDSEVCSHHPMLVSAVEAGREEHQHVPTARVEQVRYPSDLTICQVGGGAKQRDDVVVSLADERAERRDDRVGGRMRAK